MQDHDDAFNATMFGKKTFSDLLKDIYSNSKNKEKQITILIEELRPLVKTLGDATVIVPLIKEYMDVGIKNDEMLVKMAAIVQRSVQPKGTSVNSSDFDITQEEIDAMEKEFSSHGKNKETDNSKLHAKVDEIKSIVNAQNDIVTTDDVITKEE
jgi:hypothetical protein